MLAMYCPIAVKNCDKIPCDRIADAMSHTDCVCLTADRVEADLARLKDIQDSISELKASMNRAVGNIYSDILKHDSQILEQLSGIAGDLFAESNKRFELSQEVTELGGYVNKLQSSEDLFRQWLIENSTSDNSQTSLLNELRTTVQSIVAQYTETLSQQLLDLSQRVDSNQFSIEKVVETMVGYNLFIDGVTNNIVSQEVNNYFQEIVNNPDSSPGGSGDVTQNTTNVWLGDNIFNGDTIFNDNTTVNGPLTVNNISNFYSTANFDAPVTINEKFTVNADSYFNGDSYFNNDVHISGNLDLRYKFERATKPSEDTYVSITIRDKTGSDEKDNVSVFGSMIEANSTVAHTFLRTYRPDKSSSKYAELSLDMPLASTDYSLFNTDADLCVTNSAPTARLCIKGVTKGSSVANTKRAALLFIDDSKLYNGTVDSILSGHGFGGIFGDVSNSDTTVSINATASSQAVAGSLSVVAPNSVGATPYVYTAFPAYLGVKQNGTDTVSGRYTWLQTPPYTDSSKKAVNTEWIRNAIKNGNLNVELAKVVESIVDESSSKNQTWLEGFNQNFKVSRLDKIRKAMFGVWWGMDEHGNWMDNCDAAWKVGMHGMMLYESGFLIQWGRFHYNRHSPKEDYIVLPYPYYRSDAYGVSIMHMYNYQRGRPFWYGVRSSLSIDFGVRTDDEPIAGVCYITIGFTSDENT